VKEVFLVKSENKQKVEEILKKDDVVSRGSITIKTPQSLDIKEDGYFFILDLSEEGMKRAEELIRGVAERYKHGKDVIRKAEDQENTAIEGFGNILG